MQKQSYVILILPQPKKSGSTLESWNLLATMLPLDEGVQNKQEKILCIYTSAKFEDVSEIAAYAKDILFYKEVHVFDEVGNFSSSVKDYVHNFKNEFLPMFVEESTIIDKIFWTMGTIYPGVETYGKNTEMVKNVLESILVDSKDNSTEESQMYEGSYMEHCIYQSLLLYFSGYSMPMIHQLIVDPVEADVSIYVHDFLQNNIRRHFVHPLHNRPSVYVNPFIVQPFFDATSKFWTGTKVEKTNDFVFGLTAYDDIRKRFLFDLKDVIVDKYELFYCYFDDNKELVDTRLSYENYMKRLSESKTTLLIPAYDVETFSVHRFVEAVSLDCLPLVFDAVYEFGFAGYTDTIQFITDNLLVEDILEINSRIEEVVKNYDRILEGLLNTSYFKMLEKNHSIAPYFR